MNTNSIFRKSQHTKTSTHIQALTLYMCINIYKKYNPHMCPIYILTHMEFFMDTHKHIGIFKSLHIPMCASMLVKENQENIKKKGE